MPIDAVIDDRESPKPEDEVENISRIQAQNQTQSQMLFPMQSAAQTQNSGLTQNNSHKQERDETSNGIQPITSHHPARTASANQGPAMLGKDLILDEHLWCTHFPFLFIFKNEDLVNYG